MCGRRKRRWERTRKRKEREREVWWEGTLSQDDKLNCDSIADDFFVFEGPVINKIIYKSSRLTIYK